jgi:hypothetical protein
MSDPNIIHEQLDLWVNSLPFEFVIGNEARLFVEAVRVSHPDDFEAFVQASAALLIERHMVTKISSRRRNARKAATLAHALGGAAHPEITAASLFASQYVSRQTRDGRYVSLRGLTKAELLRAASNHQHMVKGHLLSAVLYSRLADRLPTDDSILSDHLSDEEIAAVAADAEMVAQ